MTTHDNNPDSFAIFSSSLLPPAEIDDYLARHEAARVEQLNSLDPNDHDPVAAARRDSATRILDEIRAARRRLRQGIYGICIHCGRGIAAERLEVRPWASDCIHCAQAGP